MHAKKGKISKRERLARAAMESTAAAWDTYYLLVWELERQDPDGKTGKTTLDAAEGYSSVRIAYQMAKDVWETLRNKRCSAG